MRQFIGQVRDESTVRDLLVSVAPPRVRSPPRRPRPCRARADGVRRRAPRRWPTRTRSATGPTPAATTPRCSGTSAPWRRSGSRSTRRSTARPARSPAASRSGSSLEALLRGPDEVLLLDEPDNYLDVPGKEWLEQRLAESPKTVLLVSHDRELLARTATQVVTVELGAAGNTAWTHGGGFATYHQARADRFARLEELRRRWDEEHAEAQGPRADVQGEGEVQRRHGQPLPGGQDPPREVRGGRAAAGDRARADGADAARRRAHGQARGGLRAARADRADAALRPRGVVRRAGGRARRQRLGQVALPAPARRRRQRPRRGAPPGGRGAHRTRRAHRRRPPRRAGATGMVRPDPRAPRAGRHAPCSRCCTAATTHRDGMGRELAARKLDRYELAHASEQTFESPLRRPAGALPDPAARAVRGHAAAAGRAHRQPRPRQRRGARGGARRPSRARCSRSPTTAGSPAGSTASSSSPPTARSARSPSPSGTRPGPSR